MGRTMGGNGKGGRTMTPRMAEGGYRQARAENEDIRMTARHQAVGRARHNRTSPVQEAAKEAGMPRRPRRVATTRMRGIDEQSIGVVATMCTGSRLMERQQAQVGRKGAWIPRRSRA
jgi:hypothetical protein